MVLYHRYPYVNTSEIKLKYGETACLSLLEPGKLSEAFNVKDKTGHFNEVGDQ